MEDFYYQSPSGNYFNEIWYKNKYNIDEENLLKHYCEIGHKLNYNPSLYFETKWYKNKYNLSNDTNPLEHFCKNNTNINLKPNSKCNYFIRDINFHDWTIIPKHDFVPISNVKKINLLLPGEGLSGGPATIYLFANLLSNINYNVRIIFTFGLFSENFINKLKKKFILNDNIEFDSLEKNHINISYDDIFITSAWWTVYPLKFILDYLNFNKFFWFIQENELLLHAGDETYAKALSCYNMKYYSFINSSILMDDIKKTLYPFNNINYLNNNCICFEPAFNKTKLYYISKHIKKQDGLKIIFYSRDENIAKRNCLKLVKNLLISGLQNDIIKQNDKIVGFGGSEGKKLLINNYYYEDLGFLDNDDYYKLLRESDLLISFQMAPHPSYPPLEKSFCNGLTLHTCFSYKNSVSISRYTDKIIMCEPNINSLLKGLEKAIKIVRSNSVNNINPKLLNDNWDKPLNECLNFFTNKS